MIVRIIGGHGGVSPGARATSYLINGKLLVDAGSVGEGIVISEQVAIDHILISHAHLDHIKDLAFISDNCFGLRKKPFQIYSNEFVKNAIKEHLMNDVVWPDFSKLPNAKNPTIKFNIIESEKNVTIGEYKILPVPVNHPGNALGFIIEKGSKAVLFTQDTGPTDRIWKVAKKKKNLKAIFTEVSFPNSMQKVATISQHHTPKTLSEEIKKMPKNIPIFVGHLKPNYQTQLYKEIEAIKEPRITLLGSDDRSYLL